jgi:hypothetical protein
VSCFISKLTSGSSILFVQDFGDSFPGQLHGAGLTSSYQWNLNSPFYDSCPKWLSTPTQPIAVDDVLAYLRQKRLRRWLISVPVLTPYLSSLWLALVTPASFEVGRHLIEGLKNPTIVRDKTALQAFPIRPMGIQEAVQKALTGSA